jgi:TP901 family phage tail tape measure protein
MATKTDKIVIQVQVKGAKDISNLGKSTDKATKSAGGFTKSMIKAGAAIGSALIIFRQLNRTIGEGIRTFKSYEFQMSKVKAITGASGAEFKRLNDTAQELGRTTFFTATQVAELQTNYGKLGFTTEEILNAQKATLDLATATDSDLGRAAIVAGAAVRGFGLDASETARVVDVMAVAFTSSALDIEKWQTGMTKVAPIAKSAGFSIEDTAAIMSKLADSGIEASIAGTSLRNILLKMQDPSSDLVNSFGTTIHSLDQLVPALQKFVAEGGSMADIMEVVDLRQAAAFEQMITSADATVKLRDSLEVANGAAAKMAEIVGDNMEGAMKRFSSALQGLAIIIVESFVGKAIQQAIDATAKWLNTITLLLEGFDSIEEKIAAQAQIYGGQARELRTMANRYDELSKQVNRTAKEDEELEKILRTLQTELGDTVISIDDTTDALILNREALDDVIAKTALLADTEALKLIHKIKNIQKQVDAEKSLKKSLEETQKAQVDNTSFMEEVLNEQISVNDQTQVTTRTFDAFGDKVDDSTSAMDEMISTETDLQASQTRLKELEEEMLVLVDMLENSWGSLEEAEDLLNQTTEKSNKTRTKQRDGLDKELTVTQELAGWKKQLAMLELKYNQAVLDGVEGLKEFRDIEIESIEQALQVETLSTEARMELTKRLHELKLENMEDEEKKRLEQKEFALNTASELSNALFEIDSNNQKRIQDQDLKMLEERKEAGVITQAEYERQVDEINRQAFQREKNANIAKAIMETALAIIEGAPNPLKMQLAAVAGAAQLAVISAQKYALGGMVQGKSHAQGGEKFAVGGRVVELEGGEAVINKRSTSMYKPLLSSINSMGGGVKFADGGLLNQPAFTQSQFNAIGQAGMMGAIAQGNKVVVVESDITDSQNAVSVIQSQAGF